MYLQGNFFCRGKKYRLTLKDSGLSWEPEGTPDLFQSVIISEIISCWLCPRGSPKCCEAHFNPAAKKCLHQIKSETATSSGGLTIEFCRRKESRKWTSSKLVFMHVAKEILLTWYEALWTAIKGLQDRPQKLYVVINPVGGKKKANQIYTTKIHPLFIRAGIQIVKTKTDYRGHGTELVQEAADEGFLKECDGVVAVGGDGLVNEIATGLFIVASNDRGINPHDPNIDLPVTGIRLGIIPSGSTDAMCFATHGSSDPITAALHIIMGDRRGVDVASIHTESQLRRIVTTLISYGYFGDLLRSSEGLRCIGPPRYLLSGLQQIIKNRSYPVKIKVRSNMATEISSSSSNSINSTVSCNSVCSICSHYMEDTDRLIEDSSDENWREISGNFSVVSAAISSCACRLTPQGVSPSAHLGDGQTDLILVKGSSRRKLLSYLYHTAVTGNAANLDHVEMIRTNEIQFSSSPTCRINSSWNCDGEEMDALSLNIKVHRQKLNVFCRGIEDPFQSLNSKNKNTL